jgi:DNA-binding NarL/FixJ family response regulator
VTIVHDLVLVTSYDIDRLGLSTILDSSMKYKVHTVRPCRITPCFFETLNHQPIGLIDADLQDTDPIEVAGILTQYKPGMPVLLFARSEAPRLFLRGVATGLLGMIPKSDEPQDLLRKLDCASERKSLWNKEEIRRFQSCLSCASRVSGLEVPLTHRESDVLSKLSSGLTNKGIAEELGISCETVKEHVQHILRKIGVNDRTQAAVWAVRNRLF